jgi:hypothetical protein
MRKSLWIILVVLVVGLSARNAHADAVVTAGGITYDITITAPTTFESSSATLESTPWWGNLTLAGELTGLVETDLGLPNGGGNVGPLFAYSLGPTSDLIEACAFAFHTIECGGASVGPDFTYVFAVGSVVSAPEPGTLTMLFVSVLGVCLLVGVKRYRGNRLATIA